MGIGTGWFLIYYEQSTNKHKCTSVVWCGVAVKLGHVVVPILVCIFVLMSTVKILVYLPPAVNRVSIPTSVVCALHVVILTRARIHQCWEWKPGPLPQQWVLLPGFHLLSPLEQFNVGILRQRLQPPTLTRSWILVSRTVYSRNNKVCSINKSS